MIPVQWSANGHWYALNSTRLSWADAKAAAEASSYNGMAGHLVTITSAEENGWLYNMFGSELTNPFHWIGAHQSNPELLDTGWAWVTGEEWKYTNWAENEPNDYFASNPPYFTYEGAVHFYPVGAAGWADTVGALAFPSVIEYEPATTIAIAPLAADKLEGNSGTTPFTFSVTRTGDLTGTSTVQYAVGGAVNATDFGGKLPAGMVIFKPGQTAKTVTLNVYGDQLAEPDEAFTVTLSAPVNATLGTATAGGVIRNDDGVLSIAATDANRLEGTDPDRSAPFTTRNFSFTVSRVGDRSQAVTLDYAVTGSGANPADADDFFQSVLPAGKVTIPAGQDTAKLNIRVLEDHWPEADEGFTVTLSNATVGTLGTATANGLIRNDDAGPLAPPVDALRGRWDIDLTAPGLKDTSVRLFINDLQPRDDRYVASGCMESSGGVAPLLFWAEPLAGSNGGPEGYFISARSTFIPLQGSPFAVQLQGPVQLFGRGIADDVAGGEGSTLRTEFGEGSWSGVHHDLLYKDCPDVEIPPLTMWGDVRVSVEYSGYYGGATEPVNVGTGFEVQTDIAAAAARVERPDGTTVILEQQEDWLAGWENFAAKYVFGSGDPDPGYPVSGGVYRFTLLDPSGREIAGATVEDTWTAFTLPPPGNLRLSLDPRGLRVAWDPVTPDRPDESISYGVQIFDESSGSGALYVGEWIAQAEAPEHIIPYSFEPGAPGIPDGNDLGTGLNALPPGATYSVGVWANSTVPGTVWEGWVTDFEERVQFTKEADGDIIIL